jgi:hypothetical protein
MGPLISSNCKYKHERSKLCIVALWFVGQGSSNHNHFQGQITSYRYAWAKLTKGMFMKVQNFNIESKSKKGFEKGDVHVDYSGVNDDCVTNHNFWT